MKIMKASDAITTSIFEIKIGRKGHMVRATTCLSLDKYCAKNGIKDWRMVGMLSISEMAESQSLEVVA